MQWSAHCDGSILLQCHFRGGARCPYGHACCSPHTGWYPVLQSAADTQLLMVSRWLYTATAISWTAMLQIRCSVAVLCCIQPLPHNCCYHSCPPSKKQPLDSAKATDSMHAVLKLEPRSCYISRCTSHKPSKLRSEGCRSPMQYWA